MKKRFQVKPIKKRNKKIISLFVIILIIYCIFQLIDTSKIKISNKDLVVYMLKQVTNTKENISLLSTTEKIFTKIYNNPTHYLLTSQSKLIKKENKTEPAIKKEENKSSPIIYIYNSHQTEEYAPSSFLEYSVNPTVMMSDYILEDSFNNKKYKTLVEESSIKEILTKNNWSYSNSYKASRQLLEQRKKENPSLKYFIDVHRDSLKKDRTTITINNKDYAKILFIVGLENPNFQANLDFTNKINECLNTKYPSLSKGIYKKEGTGVNGVYNQDFSPFTILVEIGGYENTTTEVMNSSLAFSECFMEVISSNEFKTTN